MRSPPFRPWSLLAAVLLLVFLQRAAADVSGKIAGTVTTPDGMPLPGVNVVIADTRMGASTDPQGRYYILNVPAGTYRLQASMIGYQVVTMTGVQVVADLTADIDFVLPETVLDIGQVIEVSADRPLIRKDATSKTTTISAGDLKDMPVEDIPAILSTQANVSVLSGLPSAKEGYNIRGIDDIRMRGGRNNEVALMIDGVKVSNPIFGGFGTRLSNSAINQMTITSGAFNAEYGNALSGVVNLTTREGGRRLSGSLKYRTSVPFGIPQLATARGRALNYREVQTSLGGPVPFIDGMKFFSSAEVKLKAGDVYEYDDIVWDDHRHLGQDVDGDGRIDTTIVLPTSGEIRDGYLRYGSLDSIQAGLGSRWDDVAGPDGREINPLDTFTGWQRFGWDNSNNVFLKLTYQLGPNIKVTASGMNDQRYRQINNRNGYYIYQMSGQNVQVLSSNKETVRWVHQLSPATFYTLHLSRFFEMRKTRILRDYADRYRSSWWVFGPDWDNIKSPDEYIAYSGEDALRDPFESAFYMRADNRWYEGDSSTNYEFRADLTSQIHRLHQIKTGLLFNRWDIDYHSYQNISQTDPFPTIYQRQPEEGAAYVQVKSELGFMVINLGSRLDYSNSGGDFWVDPLDPLGEQDLTDDDLEYNAVEQTKKKFKVSPRLGIAYPLTDRTVLHFNFGHFYQHPNYRDLYRASGDNREISLIKGNLIGNPNLEPELSVQYEIGLQHQIGEMYGIKLNLWSKETTNQVGSVRVPAYQDAGADNPYTYSVFINNNFGSARGLDLTIDRRYADHFSGSLNYTWSVSRVLQPTSWDGYWSGDTQRSGPKSEQLSPWDQTHVLRVNVNLRVPRDEGPRWRSLRPLSAAGLNLIGYAETGRPYTPSISGGVLVEPMSARWPAYYRLDVRASKSLFWAALEWRWFLEIKNLFDRRNVVTGYTLTGSATNPGTSSYYTRSSTYWDSRNTNNFGLRRAVQLGMELIF